MVQASVGGTPEIWEGMERWADFGMVRTTIFEQTQNCRLAIVNRGHKNKYQTILKVLLFYWKGGGRTGFALCKWHVVKHQIVYIFLHLNQPCLTEPTFIKPTKISEIWQHCFSIFSRDGNFYFLKELDFKFQELNQ
jgi:hypothetical protein